MKYITLTVIENIKVSGTSHENSQKELEKYLSDGYKIISMSASHNIKSGVSFADIAINPTPILIVISYLLSKEDGGKG